MDLTNEHVEMMTTPGEDLPARSRVIEYLQRQPDDFQADSGYGSCSSSVQDDREVEYELENARLQVLWDEQMRKRLSTKQHQKVAVLTISWDEDQDNLNTQPEVDALRCVFEDIYSYHVTSIHLRHDKQSHLHLNFGLSRFLDLHDDKHTLLIVYYAGHSILGDAPGQLQLTGKSQPRNVINYSAVVWNHAETSLQNTRADVLEIFDCCYGGFGLGRARGPRSSRCFESIAATSVTGTTNRPGERSFTSALIWTLTALAAEGRRFTTSELLWKIRTHAPHFPRHQLPVLTRRGEDPVERIVLAPLAKDSSNGNLEELVEDDIKDSEPKDREYLELRFMLGRHPSVREIEDLARGLGLLCSQKDSLPISRVEWRGLHSSQISSISSYGLSAESRKIVQQNNRHLGAEHKPSLQSIIFRSFVTLLLRLFSLYYSGSPLLYTGTFYMIFLIMLINIDLVEASCSRFAAEYVWKPSVSAFRYMSRPAVSPGYIRVPWECHCGKTSYDDFVEHQPGATVQLMVDLEIQTRPNSVLPTTEPRRNGTSTALSFRSILSRYGGNNRQLHHDQGNSLTPMPEIWMGPDSNILSPNSSDKTGSVVACINGFHTQPEMFHLYWEPGLNDRAMFMQMQRQYYQVRGKWKRWLSLWSLHSVLFIQFEAFPHQLVNIRKEHDLPPEDPHHRKIYAFTPRPTDICPPLGPNFLKHRVQHPDHAGEISRCCEQFPKKLLGNVTTGDVAWGLQFNEGLDRARLSVVVVAVFVSSTLVGCVFAKVKGDVQSGFAIASYMMAALAVGVCSVQLTVEQLTKS